MRILPEQGLFDSISLDEKVSHVVHRSWLGSFCCGHSRAVFYTRIDHRGGPGSFADTFKGHACIDCGKIISEEQIS